MEEYIEMKHAPVVDQHNYQQPLCSREQVRTFVPSGEWTCAE